MVYEDIFRSKWLVDGCKTLDEMIKAYERVIEELKAMKESGIKLESEIQDDYGFLITEDPEVAEKFHFQEREINFWDDDEEEVEDEEDDGWDEEEG